MTTLSDLFSKTTAAAFDAAAPADRSPLPPGEYHATLEAAGPFQSKRGTPGYKLMFKVTNGPHASRRVWHELYFTEAAMGHAKRDLMALGITSSAELQSPDWFRGIRARIKVTAHRSDSGAEFNKVSAVIMTGRDTHPGELFPTTASPAGQEKLEASDQSTATARKSARSKPASRPAAGEKS